MNIPRIPLTKTSAIIFAVAASQFGYAAGVLITRAVIKKKLEQVYAAALYLEVTKTREYYQKMAAKAKYNTPMERVEELQIFREASKAMRDYTPEEPEIPEEVVITEQEKRNIFEENEAEDAYTREIESRDWDGPYIISDEDFNENSPEHEQSMLTYYADGVLADEKDEVVELIGKTVGIENLERFGHFSGNTEIVYVRNDKLSMDFEIHRDQTEYAVTVGGQDPAPVSVRNLRARRVPPGLPARERFPSGRAS